MYKITFEKRVNKDKLRKLKFLLNVEVRNEREIVNSVEINIYINGVFLEKNDLSGL